MPTHVTTDIDTHYSMQCNLQFSEELVAESEDESVQKPKNEFDLDTHLGGRVREGKKVD